MLYWSVFHTTGSWAFIHCALYLCLVYPGTTCDQPYQPVNGQFICSEEEEGVNCTLHCKDGYSLAQEAVHSYLCPYNGVWEPTHSPDRPDCSREWVTLLFQPTTLSWIVEVIHFLDSGRLFFTFSVFVLFTCSEPRSQQRPQTFWDAVQSITLRWRRTDQVIHWGIQHQTRQPGEEQCEL